MPEQRDDGEHSDSKGTMLPACEGLRLATRGERSNGVEAEGAAGARGGGGEDGPGCGRHTERAPTKPPSGWTASPV